MTSLALHAGDQGVESERSFPHGAGGVAVETVAGVIRVHFAARRFADVGRRLIRSAHGQVESLDCVVITDPAFVERAAVFENVSLAGAPRPNAQISGTVRVSLPSVTVYRLRSPSRWITYEYPARRNFSSRLALRMP